MVKTSLSEYSSIGAALGSAQLFLIMESGRRDASARPTRQADKQVCQGQRKLQKSHRIKTRENPSFDRLSHIDDRLSTIKPYFSFQTKTVNDKVRTNQPVTSIIERQQILAQRRQGNEPYMNFEPSNP